MSSSGRHMTNFEPLSSSRDLVNLLRERLSPSAVISAPEGRAPFETDWRRLRAVPALCVVQPASTAEVVAAVELCARAGVAMVPQGGNTSLVAGAVPVPGPPQVIVSLHRMSAITALDTVGDSIVVQAGATLQSVQEAAARAGRLFPLSLAAEGTAQIGGLVATNAGGIQVLAYGSMRALVLGLEVVLPDGRVWSGLRALRKDNTGFDLKQLFIGSEGTLGIVTAACLRLFPAVAERSTALVGVASIERALGLFQILREAAGPALTMCEFIDRDAMRLASAHVAGARLPFEAAAYVLVELSAQSAESAIAQVMERALAAALAHSIADDAVIAQSERERQSFLQLREAISDAELAEGGAVKHDISVPIAVIPEAVGAVRALVAREFPGCRLNIFGHLGDGNLHVNVRPPDGKRLADLGPLYRTITDSVETLAVERGGSFSAEHGIGQLRALGLRRHKPEVDIALMTALKQAVDPRNLMNPGKILSDPTWT